MKQLFIWPILLYLRFIAKIALTLHHPTVIGIAGSVGKSSCRNALNGILSEYYSTKMIGNSETGIPLGILGIEPQGYSFFDWIQMAARAPFGLSFLSKTRYLITEMGIDDPYPPKNMKYLLSIIKPDIALSLNITGPHLMQFEKALTQEERSLPVEKRIEKILEKMADEDTKIITESHCLIGIYNADDPSISSRVSKQNLSHTKLVNFGKNQNNTLSYSTYSVSQEGTTFEFISGKEKIKTTFNGFMLPQEYQEVFAAALLAAKACDIPLEEAATTLSKTFTLPKGRASIFEGINNTTIIDSSYNAPPKAVRAFLDLVAQLKKSTKKEIVFVMGDMRELGQEAEFEHANIAQKIPGIVDYLYCVGTHTQQTVLPIVEKGKLKDTQWFENSQKAGEYLKKKLPQNSLVLVKGSQNTIFLEETVKQILKNKSDTPNLCRQEEYWMKIKQEFFNSLG